MSFTRRYQNIEDFAAAARRRLPRIFADYIEGGAFSETTMRRNRSGFDGWALRQRVLRPLGAPDLSTEVLGRRQALPFGPGPVGFLGLYRRDGDVLIAQEAAARGVPMVLSTFSINGLQTIARRSGQVPQFQLYLDIDADWTDSYVAAAEAAGSDTIFVTVDTAITSNRERDGRTGFRSVTRIDPRLFCQFAAKPVWALDLLRNGFPQVELVAGRPEYGNGALAQAVALSQRLDKNLTWEKIRRLRQRWKGRLIVKGISDVEDAEIARAEEVDGIVLSNHGGRQLDHGLSTVELIPEIRAALGPDKALYVDSGFRRGSDVVKALALGADFVLMGRPFAWAVAAEGRRGVAAAFDMLAGEIGTTLQLMGMNSVAELKAEGADALRRIG
ncbi:alpha-hydroxy acid oxidase [Mangrovicoccus algicola]|uniref:Alpha-hydroxy-acid oxidizing protein n=1 Tax=Mangrovicoccus algicola TaxID=2771008 RepID=A0A8J7CJB3_9RHOB|nr:alpha-hydroxy acid oxidase [Mangrovicoccus algicola]MBE3640605.1 alpha-hydroxy-acid oxidizing protein [Mangrovicoccus algicola]